VGAVLAIPKEQGMADQIAQSCSLPCNMILS